MCQLGDSSGHNRLHMRRPFKARQFNRVSDVLVQRYQGANQQISLIVTRDAPLEARSDAISSVGAVG